MVARVHSIQTVFHLYSSNSLKLIIRNTNYLNIQPNNNDNNSDLATWHSNNNCYISTTTNQQPLQSNVLASSCPMCNKSIPLDLLANHVSIICRAKIIIKNESSKPRPRVSKVEISWAFIFRSFAQNLRLPNKWLICKHKR